MKFNTDYLFTKKEINMMSLSKMTPKFIAVHNTANTAPAINEAKNQFNNNTKKGFNGVAVHFYVDEKETYQLLPLDIHGWHASDGGTGDGNMRSIAIEICRSKDYTTDNYAKAELRAVELVKYLMKQFNIPIQNVRRHYDFDKISRKRCPHRMFEASPNTWEQFVALVNNKPVEKPIEKPVEQPKKTIAEVAKDVINGKYGNGVARKTNLEKAGYNYLEVQTEVNRQLGIKPNEPTKPVLKPIKTIAQEVINGLWGNGYDRKNRLTKAGYDYNAVQAQVNELLKQPIAKPKLTAKQVAHEIVYGKNKYGNGNARKIALEKEGYDYNEVQNEVNKLIYK